MKPELVFTPFVSNSWADELKELFFFNGNQLKYKERIVLAIEEFGKPQLLESNQGVTVGLINNSINQQTLIVIDKKLNDKPIAILIYVKENNAIVVIHLAFNPSVSNLFNHVLLKFAEMVQKWNGIDLIAFKYKNMSSSPQKLINLLKHN